MHSRGMKTFVSCLFWFAIVFGLASCQNTAPALADTLDNEEDGLAPLKDSNYPTAEVVAVAASTAKPRSASLRSKVFSTQGFDKDRGIFPNLSMYPATRKLNAHCSALADLSTCTPDVIKSILPDNSGNVCAGAGWGSITFSDFADFPGISGLQTALDTILTNAGSSSPVKSGTGADASTVGCNSVLGLQANSQYCFVKFSTTGLGTGFGKAVSASGCLAITPAFAPVFSIGFDTGMSFQFGVGGKYGLGLTGVMACLNGCLFAPYDITVGETGDFQQKDMGVHVGIAGFFTWGKSVGLLEVEVRADVAAYLNLNPSGGSWRKPSEIIDCFMRGSCSYDFQFLFTATSTITFKVLDLFEFSPPSVQTQFYVAHTTNGWAIHVHLRIQINSLGDIFGGTYQSVFQASILGSTIEQRLCTMFSKNGVSKSVNPLCSAFWAQYGGTVLSIAVSSDENGARAVLRQLTMRFSLGKNSKGYYINANGNLKDRLCMFDSDCSPGYTCFNYPGQCPSAIDNVDFKCHRVMAACQDDIKDLYSYYAVGHYSVTDVSRWSWSDGTCESTRRRRFPCLTCKNTIDKLTQGCAYETCRRTTRAKQYICIEVPVQHTSTGGRRLNISRSRAKRSAFHANVFANMSTPSIMPRMLTALRQDGVYNCSPSPGNFSTPAPAPRRGSTSGSSKSEPSYNWIIAVLSVGLFQCQ